MARGALRIYLGAAPGVGKTYAMLDEGWRRASRGTDVVIGYLETHGRPHTIAQVRDLELIPRTRLEYRGAMFEEMDLDAVIARRPSVVLVDELAHTNVDGMRHAKRWQDVEQLLGEGIDVISTLNVQHLESLNDVVEAITGVRQRETIPDKVVRAADQIELVDMTPEALRRRMAHGNIYAPEKVDAALGNFFRFGNLSALRELGLLWMADRVEESLQDYRRRNDIDSAWEVKERVLVAMTGAEGSDALIRRAARMAMRSRGELIGVHVDSDDGLADRGLGLLDRRRAILEEVGGRYIEIGGADVPSALLDVARAENATQIVLGASRQSRFAAALRGSVVQQLIRSAGGTIDVHVISTEAEVDIGSAAVMQRRRRTSGVGTIRQTSAAMLMILLLPTLTFLLSRHREQIGLQNVLLLYLMVVVAIASVGGIWPALCASLSAFALLNWFFTPPVHTFTIANGRDGLALLTFLVVAGAVSAAVDLAARRRLEARRAHAEARTLATMAGTVLDNVDPLPRLAEQIAAAFGIDCLALLTPFEPDKWSLEASVGVEPPAAPDKAEHHVTLPDGSVIAWNGGRLHREERFVLMSFATQLTLARTRRELQRDAAKAAVLVEADQLKNALLAAVGHDLRTPLASIRAAATTLLSDEVDFDRETTKELLQTVDDEAERLNNLVGNLLDMSRLQTGGIAVRFQAVGIEEVVSASVASVHAQPGLLDVDVPETLNRVWVDPALLERAIANVVSNAIVFAPEGTRVRVEAAIVGSAVHVRVIDRGRGIPQESRDRVTQPFQRLGDHPNGLGIGLGLAVAQGFLRTCHGELRIEDTPGGGCTMVLIVPLAT